MTRPGGNGSNGGPGGGRPGLGGATTDPDEALARIDAWAQGFADKAERYQAVQEETDRIRLTAASPDGAVRVTVRADGSITDLQFGDRARTVPFENLASMVLDTMHRAQAGIAERVAGVMTERLGDEDPQTRTMMVDNLRARFPDPDADEDDTPPPPPDPTPEPPSTRDPRARRPEPPTDDDNNPW